eukprot:TRINITY_DN36678_c0_g1_i2.p2 TRINITY_DN36678_c0_g1~~TRINITY_DN36678_c0_g1_i2.p2  ORF type:complete len:386 (-),score=75.65 TRINITY_DN36678_c0_g1_i2:184-1341(-)
MRWRLRTLLLLLVCAVGSCLLLLFCASPGDQAVSPHIDEHTVAPLSTTADGRPSPSVARQREETVLHPFKSCMQCGLPVCRPEAWHVSAADLEDRLVSLGEATVGQTVADKARAGQVWTCANATSALPATILRSETTGKIYSLQGPLPASLRPVPAEALEKTFMVATDDVVFVVWTDSKFYDTRLAAVLETWGSALDPRSIILIGDKQATVGGLTVRPTGCLKNSHEFGVCCKYAAAVYAAYQWMKVARNVSWAYFTDDDAYVNVQALTARLRLLPLAGPQLVGTFGCESRHCSGLCAGGGFAMNREGLEKMLRHPAVLEQDALLEEQAAQCKRCGKWADQAISEIARQRGLYNVELDGLHAWLMTKSDFLEVTWARLRGHLCRR